MKELENEDAGSLEDTHDTWVEIDGQNGSENKVLTATARATYSKTMIGKELSVPLRLTKRDGTET